MGLNVRVLISLVAMIVVTVATIIILRFVAKVSYDSWAYQLIGIPLAGAAALGALYLTRPTGEHWGAKMFTSLAVGTAIGVVAIVSSWAIGWALNQLPLP